MINFLLGSNTFFLLLKTNASNVRKCRCVLPWQCHRRKVRWERPYRSSKSIVIIVSQRRALFADRQGLSRRFFEHSRRRLPIRTSEESQIWTFPIWIPGRLYYQLRSTDRVLIPILSIRRRGDNTLTVGIINSAAQVD